MYEDEAASWRSRKQTVLTTSSCEAEYITSFIATKEATWLSRLISDKRGSSEPKALAIHSDKIYSISTDQSTSINHLENV